MKNNPLVYIVLPVYNCEKYFLEQLMSLYYQTYTNWYLIIVNDGSTDNSEKIARDWISHYNLYDKVKILQRENGWLNAAITTWLEEIMKMCDICKSDSFVCYCDADDIWVRDKLSVQVEFMDSYLDCWLSYHDMCCIDENNDLTESSLYNNSCYVSSDFIYSASIWNPCSAVSMMFKVKYIKDILPMPIQKWTAQDFWTILILSYKWVILKYFDRKLFYRRRLSTGLQNVLEHKSQKTKNDIRMIYFEFLKHRFKTNDVFYVYEYNYDRFVRRFNKWYPQIIIYVLMMIKYPKVFFMGLKAVIYKIIRN